MSTDADDHNWYYVTQRGGRNCPVFDRERRRNVFVRAIAETALEVHGFAVLPWRYHLLVRATEAQLVAGLRKLIQSFTGWFNAMEGNRGPLLSAQCDWVAIDEQEAIQLLAEIHYSPVAAGQVNEWGHYDWSSYPAYIGATEPPAWLKMARLYPHVQQPSLLRGTIPAPAEPTLPDLDTPFEDSYDPALDGSIDVDFEDSTVTSL